MMEFFGVTLAGYSNYFREMLLENYCEPIREPPLKEILEECSRREPDRSFSELYHLLDTYVGVPDGFSYGSHERLFLQRKKGAVKCVGPMEMFRLPATCAQDVGCWTQDGVLSDDWVKPIKRFIRRKNEITKQILI